MAIDMNDPSVGINAATGQAITGWDHVIQSVGEIFTTRFGSRVMREWFGSFVPSLMGGNITANEITPFFVAMTSAISQWEPRFSVAQIQVVSLTAGGAMHLSIDGEYRPRALLGDFTARGAKRLNAYATSTGITVKQGTTG
jgi:hypothetical protein